MKTSLAIKYMRNIITAILIIAPIIIAYKVISHTFEEDLPFIDDSASIIGSIGSTYSGLQCASEILLNGSFAVMLALLWNSKEAIKIGIV